VSTRRATRYGYPPLFKPPPPILPSTASTLSPPRRRRKEIPQFRLPSTPTTAAAARHSTPAMEAATAAMVWFRKGLRVHDNPALDAARRGAGRLYPVFVLDPRYLRPDPAAASPGSARAGVARVRFLLESLADLDARLRRLGSRLLLLRARDDDVADAVCAALKDVSIRPISSALGCGGGTE